MAVTEYSPTAAGWMDCGAAPCALQLQSMGPIKFRIEGSAPSDASTAGIIVDASDPNVDIGLTGTLYVRSLGSTDKIAVER